MGFPGKGSTMDEASTPDAASRPWGGMEEGDDRLPGLSRAGVRTIREPRLVLDADLRVRAANPAFYHTFETRVRFTLPTKDSA